jgi:hypothetical protein
MTEHKFKMQNAKLKRPENGKMEKGKVDIYDRVFEFGCRIVRLHQRPARTPTSPVLAACHRSDGDRQHETPRTTHSGSREIVAILTMIVKNTTAARSR